MNQEGKLNPEQFALAMWLINRKQSGNDPPATLTPDMVPPSMRPKGQDPVRKTIMISSTSKGATKYKDKVFWLQLY